MINENEISILIPTYNNENTIYSCLTSAINTKALEILISDDLSSDNTVKIIKTFNDKRIKLFIQNRRLGLWKNHQFLLKKAKGKWIKFLQADDYLSENGLKKFCEVNDENVTIISSPSLYKNLETNKTFININVEKNIFFEQHKYLKRIIKYGNELSTPSNTLIKKNAIPITNYFWRNSLSCDLITNIIAASKGKVFFVKTGQIIRGIHSNQDTFKQGTLTFITRKVKTFLILNNLFDNKTKYIIHFYFFINIFALINEYNKNKNILTVREKVYCKSRIKQILKKLNYFYILINMLYIIKAIHFKYFSNHKYSIKEK
ncbi:MAG: glycosyltransferase family 2 protein [Bacteroidales bacterium]|nr:glycosyltransferase family 2 protein [Bacteroidales bacterium]